MLGRDLRRGSMVTGLIKKTVMADRAHFGIPKINFKSLPPIIQPALERSLDGSQLKGLSIQIYICVCVHLVIKIGLLSNDL